MKKILFLVVILLASVTFAQKGKSAGSSSSLKVGYIDEQVIYEQYPGATKAQKQIQEVAAKWTGKLDSMQTKLKAEYEEYQKQASLMTEDKKKEQQAVLVQKDQEIQQLKQEKFGEQGEIAKLRMELLKPVLEKIQKAIEKVAKEQGFSYVLTKQAALYADQTLNVTFDVLKVLTLEK